jgi:hypothetical protein
LFVVLVTLFFCSTSRDGGDRQPKEILIDSDKLTLHGLSQYYINLEENQKTRKLTELMDILGEFVRQVSSSL